MTSDYQPFDSGAWHGVCRADFAVPENDDLDNWLATIGATAGRRYASRWVAAPTETCPWFVKLLVSASDSDSLINRLKWRFRSSRMLHTWRISQELQAAGFGCPEIQLAARKRAWCPFGWPTDVLVTSPVAGRQVHELLKTQPPAEVLAAVAAELARFHAAGFAHGDCIPGNLFLEDNGRLAFIDNDRTMRTHAWDKWPRVRRNLVQFAFHLLRRNLVSRDQAQEFLVQYVQHAQWPTDLAKRELAKIWRWTDRRLATERPPT